MLAGVLDHMLSYGISNPFQPYFGLPPIFQHNLLDVIDPHQFIDVGLFVKSVVQMSDPCIEYQYRKKQDGTTS